MYILTVPLKFTSKERVERWKSVFFTSTLYLNICIYGLNGYVTYTSGITDKCSFFQWNGNNEQEKKTCCELGKLCCWQYKWYYFPLNAKAHNKMQSSSSIFLVYYIISYKEKRKKKSFNCYTPPSSSHR